MKHLTALLALFVTTNSLAGLTQSPMVDSVGSTVTSETYDGKRALHVASVRLGASNAAYAQVSVTANTSTLLVASRPARKFLHIINNGGRTLYLRYGAAAVANQGLAIPSGTMFTMESSALFLGDIYGIMDQSRTIEVIEGY